MSSWRTRVCAALLLAAQAAVAAAGDRVLCTRVVDGDTFHARGVGKVRLLGVDAPELAREGRPEEAGAARAMAFLKSAIEGRMVELDYDVERRDKYGRTLAYVTGPDGRVVNEELLRMGLAEPIRFFPYKMKEKYLRISRGK